MEHTFFIYYREQTFGLESLVKQFGNLKMPMNRSGIAMGVDNEISRFNFNPFNQEFCGLEVTFLFSNRDKKYNKLYPKDIKRLDSEYEYEQRCFLSFHNLENPNININQINLVRQIYEKLATPKELLTYSNGHFHYVIKPEQIRSNTDKLVVEIKNWNN